MRMRVALVTGAASGIGLDVAESLVKTGYNVVMADINEVAGQEQAARVGGYFVRADLSKREDCKALVDAAVAKFDSVDVLVNNAGIQYVSPLEEFPEDKWDFMISLMLNAPFLLTRYAWPSMKERKWGRIIHINSVHGLVASPFKSAYISAKHGLSGLTKAAALEGGPHGITVNSICPAYVRTQLVDNQISTQARVNNITEDEVIETILLKKAAIKRLIATNEVASLVTYLCSDDAACITGSMINMDCGWCAS